MLSSRRSRASVSNAGSGSVYSARGSEAHDSAEELRLMIEKRDREADRLENVRACCDGMFDSPITQRKEKTLILNAGKHDVGSLSKNGRHHSHSHSHRNGRQSPAGFPVVAE